jgi:hypothetical protein
MKGSEGRDWDLLVVCTGTFTIQRLAAVSKYGRRRSAFAEKPRYSGVVGRPEASGSRRVR